MAIIPEKTTVKYVPPFEDLTMLIYGVPGAGKTTFCNGDLNSITAATEPGADFVDTRAVKVNNWDQFLDLIEEMKQGLVKDKDFSSGIVIDIVDNLYDSCMNYICKQLNIRHPSDKNDFGKTWKEIFNEWKSWLSYLMSFSSVRFISHMTERGIEKKNENGLTETINQLVPKFHSSSGAKFLDGVCNLVGFMYTNKKGQHCITFKAHNGLVVKDRTGILRELEEIVLPEEPKDGFNYVAKIYEQRAIEKGYEIKRRPKL